MKKTLLLVLCLFMCCYALAGDVDVSLPKADTDGPDVSLPKPDTDTEIDIHLKGPKVDIEAPDINTEGPDYWGISESGQTPVDFEEPEVDVNLPKADVEISAPKDSNETEEPESTPAPKKKPVKMPKTGDSTPSLTLSAVVMAISLCGYVLLSKKKA